MSSERLKLLIARPKPLKASLSRSWTLLQPDRSLMPDLSAVTYRLSVMLEDGETVSLQKVGSHHAEAFAREAAEKGFFYEIGDAGVFIPGRRIKTVWIRAA